MYFVYGYTVRVDSFPHRKWREIQQQPGTAGPGTMLGCCLIFLLFLWGKLSTRTVLDDFIVRTKSRKRAAELRDICSPLAKIISSERMRERERERESELVFLAVERDCSSFLLSRASSGAVFAP